MAVKLLLPERWGSKRAVSRISYAATPSRGGASVRFWKSHLAEPASSVYLEASEMQPSASESITGILRDLEQSRFFGTLELKFDSGRIVLLKKTETLKPEDLRRTRVNENGRS
jgi:hypothetical protein